MSESRMITTGTSLGLHIRSLLQMLYGKDGMGSLRRDLAKGAAGTFILKITATGLSFIISVLLARLLGASGYGAYAYAMAWVNLLVVPSVLGLDKLLVRDVAAYQVRSAWGLMRGFLRRANQAALFVSVGLASIVAVIAWVFAGRFESQMLPAFWIGMVFVPLAALMRLRQAALQGLYHVVVGQLPDMFIRPLLFITLLAGAYLFLREDLNAPWALGMNVAAAGVALFIGTRFLRGILPQPVQEASPVYQTRLWAGSALPLLFFSGMQVINAQADTIMLGAMKGAELTGIYAVAKRGAEFIAFFLIAVNAALAPTIASLYAAGDMERLQRVITKSARVVLSLSLPVALVLIFFGYWFLLLFGQDFTRGDTALAILCAGQIINAAMGSVGLVLIMTAYGTDAAMGIGISAILNIVLNAILIPLWGLEGAAVATASSMMVWNLLLAVQVYRRLGIHTTALGKIGSRVQA